jgi:hypothetical protein
MRRSRSISTIVGGVTVGLALWGQAALAASSQTSWYRNSSSTTYCSGLTVAGWINFCRYPFGASSWNNAAQARDSDLRSSTSGVFHDKYLDNYIVGNFAGAVANTYNVTNNFSTPNPYTTVNEIRVYASTCYQGLNSKLEPGWYYQHANYAGLMSFKGVNAPGC